VLVFRPLVASLANAETAWLALAMASTLAGNFTILASVANLIVVEKARPAVTITFKDYFRAGAPLTVVSLAVGVAWLILTR
jgi:Na+/H+ antiporter NhaD/arsenite permease-like protein